MPNNLQGPQFDVLFDAILSLESREACIAFFEDLCTMTELRAMAQRFQVAGMLHAGSVYADIVSETGASTATISRVNRALLYGANGYKQVLGQAQR